MIVILMDSNSADLRRTAWFRIEYIAKTEITAIAETAAAIAELLRPHCRLCLWKFPRQIAFRQPPKTPVMLFNSFDQLGLAFKRWMLINIG